MELNHIKNCVDEFSKELEEKKNKVEELKYTLSSIDKTLSLNEKDLKDCEDKSFLYENAKKIINDIILSTRDEAIKFIEDVVTCGLQEVFTDKNLKLKLQLKTEGAKTAIELFIEDEGELYSIERSRGGGLRDIVSIAILICIRSISRPKIELPLLLDESLKFLNSVEDNDYTANAFRFIKNICEKLDTQIIFITGKKNKEAIRNADNVICVSQKDKVSRVEYGY